MQGNCLTMHFVKDIHESPTAVQTKSKYNITKSALTMFHDTYPKICFRTCFKWEVATSDDEKILSILQKIIVFYKKLLNNFLFLFTTSTLGLNLTIPFSTTIDSSEMEKLQRLTNSGTCKWIF